MGCRRVGDQRRQATKAEQAIPEYKSTDRRAFLPKLSGAVFVITGVTHSASCRKPCRADCQSWSPSTGSEYEPVAPFQLSGGAVAGTWGISCCRCPISHGSVKLMGYCQNIGCWYADVHEAAAEGRGMTESGHAWFDAFDWSHT